MIEPQISTLIQSLGVGGLSLYFFYRLFDKSLSGTTKVLNEIRISLQKQNDILTSNYNNIKELNRIINSSNRDYNNNNFKKQN